MIVCISAQPQVPNDLLLSGIKGKVKTMTIDKTFANGYKSRDIYNYSEEGYLTSDFFFDNEVELGEYSNDVVCYSGMRYSNFSSGNSRAVFPKDCDISEKETKYQDYLEFWLDNRQKIYVYDMRYSEGAKYTKEFYDEGYRLIKIESYHTTTYNDKTDVRKASSDYTYDTKGDLIKRVYYSNYDGIEEEKVFINKVVEKDKQGIS